MGLKAGFFNHAKCCLFIFVFFPCPAFGLTQVYELTKNEAISKAKESSERLKSSISDFLAAREQAEATYTLLLPRLTLDGTYRYVTQVPSIQIPIPGATPIPIGTNNNYSIGPTLSYTLWDSGATINAYRGQIKLSESRKQDEKNVCAQLIGSVKTTYTQVQLGLEELGFVKNSLDLARAQNREIVNRFRAGTATRLDLLTSQREVLNYELQFKQQQATLASSLRDLLALLEDQSVSDPSLPTPPGFPKASIWLRLEPLLKTLREASEHEPESLNPNSPQIKSQDLLADSLEYAAKSQAAGSYPQVQISARTSLDYPNGPVIQMINQNTFSASLSMPLFEFEHTRHLAAEKEKEAESARHRKNQLQFDIQRDFLKAKALLASLRTQQGVSEETVIQSETLASLNYESYKNGRITLVDVQAANVRAFQAKIDLARIRSQIINQIAILETLSGKEN